MTSSPLRALLERVSSLDDDTDVGILGQTFDACLKIHELLEGYDSNSEEFKETVPQTIELLERCTHRVNELCLFSSNETVDEIATTDLRYLLLPALLGTFHMKSPYVDSSKRLEHINITQIYFDDFLHRCNNYEICSETIQSEMESRNEHDAINSSLSSTSHNLAAEREKKTRRFRTLKQLKDTEKMLKMAMEKSTADEESIRKFYLVLIQKWIHTVLEESEFIEKEKDLLAIVEQTNRKPAEDQNIKKANPLRPIIVTRNELQKKVFGLGYPSVPVMSIEDFYQQRFHESIEKQSKDKSLQEMANRGDTMNQKEVEQIAKEQLIETDDLEALQKARVHDDWMDDNPRGSGNRYNKG